MPGYELFGEEERNAVNELFDQNGGVMFAHGFTGIRKGVYKVREFERAVAERLSVRHAQAVSSGSAALLVALRALGVRRGDEVITSAFTFIATVEAIIEAGGTPVIAEVDESLNMNPQDVARRITPRTKGLIPVHMAGAPADMDSLTKLAADHGLWVLEDAAQCFGGEYHGRCLGTVGDIGAFSFDFAKNITTGEGGMVVTNDPNLFERARAYHDHGHEYNMTRPRGRDTRSLPGFNYRLTEVQGAIGLAQLEKLDRVNGAQRANKAQLKEALSDLELRFRHLHDADGEVGDSLIFFLESELDADRVARGLEQHGLATKNLPDALDWHYAGTWQHLFGDFPSLKDCDRLWPVTDGLLRRAIALPVSVLMTDADIERVSGVVRDLLNG